MWSSKSGWKKKGQGWDKKGRFSLWELSISWQRELTVRGERKREKENQQQRQRDTDPHREIQRQKDRVRDTRTEDHGGSEAQRDTERQRPVPCWGFQIPSSVWQMFSTQAAGEQTAQQEAAASTPPEAECRAQRHTCRWRSVSWSECSLLSLHSLQVKMNENRII